MNELRPDRLSNIIGQSSIKERLEIAIKSAKSRNTPLAHLILCGGAGGGKTTLAIAVANEMEGRITLLNGGAITKKKDILPVIIMMKENDIIFVDEIHRIPVQIQEMLFTVMEDFRLDLGKGLRGGLPVKPFTLIGATTDFGMLLQPFRDRFNIYHLESYSPEEIKTIISINAGKLELEVDDVALLLIAKRSRGTPRVAIKYLKWIRDYALSESISKMDVLNTKKAMDIIGVDKDGLNDSDRMYLNVLRRAKKPLGLNTLVAATRIDKQTIEKVIEPYLIELGMLDKTAKGRVLI